DVGSRLHVPAPGMPRAHGHRAFELPFSQRSSAVGAGIVEGVEGPIHVEEGERLALGGDHAGFSDRPVGDLRDTDAVAHAVTGTPRPERCPSRSSPAFFTPTSK